MKSIISCVAWVKKGVAASNPQKVELEPQELHRIIKEAQTNLGDDDSDENLEVQEQKIETETPGDEYNFSKYDAESGNIHCNIANIASFEENGKDPLITSEDADDSEEENEIIKSNDNLLLVGHVDDNLSILEVYVYNETEGSFYCHHDILLPSFPLCIEWLNFDPTDPKPCNLCAIGNMSPIIDVWDLDLIDCLEPAFRLGRNANKNKNLKRIGHKDSVLDVAWNSNYTHILASGSVDRSVLLWDLQIGTPANKFTDFKEKVQSVKWHPTETHQLLTGCADNVVRLHDCKHEEVAKSWVTLGEVERVLWDHFNTNYCLASTANGYVQCMDVRQDTPIWNLEAHTQEVAGMSLSSACPGLLVTSGNDGFVKVWDIINAQPTLVWEEKSSLGALLCLASCPDNPFVFAAGGDNKAQNIKIYNLLGTSEICETFQERDFTPEQN